MPGCQNQGVSVDRVCEGSLCLVWMSSIKVVCFCFDTKMKMGEEVCVCVWGGGNGVGLGGGRLETQTNICV